MILSIVWESHKTNINPTRSWRSLLLLGCWRTCRSAGEACTSHGRRAQQRSGTYDRRGKQATDGVGSRTPQHPFPELRRGLASPGPSTKNDLAAPSSSGGGPRGLASHSFQPRRRALHLAETVPAVLFGAKCLPPEGNAAVKLANAGASQSCGRVGPGTFKRPVKEKTFLVGSPDF